jgi:hypothetical protein
MLMDWQAMHRAAALAIEEAPVPSNEPNAKPASLEGTEFSLQAPDDAARVPQTIVASRKCALDRGES